MDDREVFNRHCGDVDARRADYVDRQRGGEREWEVADGFAEFVAIGSVPGVDGVERFEFRDTVSVDDAEEFDAGVGDGSGVVGELD